MDKQNITILYLCIISLFGFSGCKDKQPDVEVKQTESMNYYYLLVGTQLENEGTALRAKDENFTHRITVFINNNPVYCSCEPTGIFQINPFIRNGINHIRICTEGPQRIESAVTTTQDFLSSTTLNTMVYEPDAGLLTFNYEFTADINYTLPIYMPEHVFSSNKDEVRNKALLLVERIDQLNHKHDFETSASLLYAGEKLWSFSAAGIPAVTIDNKIKDWATNPIQSKYFLSHSYEPDMLEIIYGNNLILVYRKDDKNVFLPPEMAEGPVTIATINGKYVVWTAMP